jgi:hypothetical protein
LSSGDASDRLRSRCVDGVREQVKNLAGLANIDKKACRSSIAYVRSCLTTRCCCGRNCPTAGSSIGKWGASGRSTESLTDQRNVDEHSSKHFIVCCNANIDGPLGIYAACMFQPVISTSPDPLLSAAAASAIAPGSSLLKHPGQLCKTICANISQSMQK